MSQENVEMIREAFRRSYEGGEGAPLPEFWHPDAEYHTIADPDGSVQRGLEAITLAFREWEEAYPDFRSEVLDIKGKDDKVLVWQRATGRGAVSGVPTELIFGQLYTIRDKKIVRVDEYRDRDEALKAVGLEE